MNYTARDAQSADSTGAADPQSARDAVLHVLLRRKGVVLACTALALLVAGAYLLTATPMYRASTRIYIEQPNNLGIEQIAGEGVSNPNFQFRQVEVIRSTPIRALAVTRDDVKSTNTMAEAGDPFAWLDEHVEAEVGRNDDLITISVEAPSPDDAAVIANGVRDAYIDYQTSQKKNTVVEVLNILRAERTRAEEELGAKTKKMLDFRRSRGVVASGDEKHDITMQRLQSLSDALTKAQLDTLEAKVAHEEATAAIAQDPAKAALMARFEREAGVGGHDRAQLESYRQEIQRWEDYLQQLRGTFLPDHPRVKQYQRRLDQLNVQYAVALGRRFTAAKTREADLESAFQRQQKDAINRSADTEEYKQLQADAQRIEQHVDDLAKRIKELNVTQAGSGLNITVVEQARRPDGKSSPQAVRTLAIALAMGLMLGVMVALTREWADPRLHSAEQIKAVLGLPVLGQLPEMDGSVAPSVRGQQVLVDPTSSAAEACRLLRTAVQFGVPAGHSKTILVASPSPGDGKSTVASNLAIAFAQAGKRVLLVDADLRQPVQQDTFGVEDEIGLSSVLSEETTLEKAIQRSTVANLDVLPCGPSPENPAELLNSQAFIDVLETLADKYDHVIIDSPPVAGVTDARIIAASCDITLLVLRANASNRKLAEVSRDGLISVGGNLLGVVVNGVKPEAAPAGYVGSRSRGGRPQGAAAGNPGLIASALEENAENGPAPIATTGRVLKMGGVGQASRGSAASVSPVQGAPGNGKAAG